MYSLLGNVYRVIFNAVTCALISIFLSNLFPSSPTYLMREKLEIPVSVDYYSTLSSWPAQIDLGIYYHVTVWFSTLHRHAMTQSKRDPTKRANKLGEPRAKGSAGRSCITTLQLRNIRMKTNDLS